MVFGGVVCYHHKFQSSDTLICGMVCDSEFQKPPLVLVYNSPLAVVLMTLSLGKKEITHIRAL